MLFLGDDWAEEHRDIEIPDETGKVLAKKRLPEGLAGMIAFHELLGRHEPTGWADRPGEAAGRVVIGIETDHGPWGAALVAAGYRVYAINPTSAARYRQRDSMSGAKADATDAHLLAEIVRVDRAHNGRSSATVRRCRRSGGGPDAPDPDLGRDEAPAAFAFGVAGVLSRCDQVLRRGGSPDTLELLTAAPDPEAAAKLTKNADHSGAQAGSPPQRRRACDCDHAGRSLRA